MALLWADGFDAAVAAAGGNPGTYLALFYTPVNWTFVGSGVGRTGTGIAVTPNGHLTRLLGSSPTTVIVGYGMNSSGSVNLNLMAGGSTNLQVSFNVTTGVVSVVRGSTTLASTAGGVFSGSTWGYWEVKVLFSQTVGTYEVHKDGVAVLSGTGVDTCNTANAYCDTVQVTGGSSSFYDDLYVCDDSGTVNNDFLGDVAVKLRKPDADGSQEDWTPSTGTDSYALVDEVPFNSDTDYLETSTNGHVSRFLHEDVDSGDTVLAVVQTAVCRKTDAGSGSARLHQYSGGVAYNGSTVALSTSYQALTQILETDPATAAAWTPAGVNAAEFGVEAVI